MPSYTDLTTEFSYKDLLTWQNMDKLAENDAYLKAILDSANIAPGDIRMSASVDVPTGWAECDGSAITRAGNPLMFARYAHISTVTMTIASPCVVTWTANGLRNGMPVKFSTSGALPTGLTAGTTYYVINKSTNTFNVATTPGGAAINTSGSQSGTHTGIVAPYGDGDGSTTFNVPDFRGRAPIGFGTGSGLTNRGLAQAVGQETVSNSHSVSFSGEETIQSNSGEVSFSNFFAIKGVAALGSGDDVFLRGRVINVDAQSLDTMGPRRVCDFIVLLG